MTNFDLDHIAASIREEVKNYYDEDFADTDDFTKDMNLLSDDLSAIALTLERQLGVKLDRNEYGGITNVRSYAEAIRRHLE